MEESRKVNPMNTAEDTVHRDLEVLAKRQGHRIQELESVLAKAAARLSPCDACDLPLAVDRVLSRIVELESDRWPDEKQRIEWQRKAEAERDSALVQVTRLEAELATMKSRFDDWLPTVDNVNALPESLRRYVHDLETRCDPAGDVASLTIARDQLEQLQARLSQSYETVNEKMLDALEQALLSIEADEKAHRREFGCGVVAREAVVAAHAQNADDATPVDENWLTSIGSVIDHSTKRCSWLIDGNTVSIRFFPKIESRTASLAVGMKCVRDNPTRGDVRRLLAALGIQSAPSSQPSDSSFGCVG